ncbi:GTPase IMAP family member 6-like [Amia ocellicauda]|uniref:GTPase IMAP family member 6-like n=1 Tax=Amia ocellicauda TaxID=2972642 RepID=UPI0034645F7C
MQERVHMSPVPENTPRSACLPSYCHLFLYNRLRSKQSSVGLLRVTTPRAEDWAGKTVSSNIIRGREEFQTKISTGECVKRQGEVAGRQVTVVETPGWIPVQATPECVKQGIVRSVSLCPPGPHALLLVIPVVPFTETDRRSVQEHLELLSERVWRHTIVLFTWGDKLRDTSIEQHIERGGQELQWLVEKCGNRYHVLNNSNRGDGTQVTELLDKIEEMMSENRGDMFVSEEELQELERRDRRLEELKQRTGEDRRKRGEELPMKRRNRSNSYEEMRKTLKLEESTMPGRRRRSISINLPPNSKHPVKRRRSNSMAQPPSMSGGAAAEGSPGETAAQPEASSSEEKTVERPGAP